MTESALAKVKINYVVYSVILKVEEVFEEKYISGFGRDAVFQRVSKGWYMHLQGSHEAIRMGAERPLYNVGDKIKITFERIDDAKLS